MFEEISGGGGGLTDSEAFNLLQELNGNTTEEIRRQRAHFRIDIKAGVTLQPGNASELLSFKVQGVTGDISEGGLNALFPMPARVGDVYRLHFDRTSLAVPMTFAQCVRCRLVKEDAYESGFRFFAPISLPDTIVTEAESSSY